MQENKEKDVVKFENDEFYIEFMFCDTNKPHLSAYPCTPLGRKKGSCPAFFLFGLSILHHFSSSPKGAAASSSRSPFIFYCLNLHGSGINIACPGYIKSGLSKLLRLIRLFREILYFFAMLQRESPFFAKYMQIP